MIWKEQSPTFPAILKIAWTWSAIDPVQSPEGWHKNCAGARHILSVYLAESDIQNSFKTLTQYRIKSTTSTRSHANKNKHKNDNWFREHFGQNLSSQNTRNGVSEHQDFKIFWGSMPQTPLVPGPFFIARLIGRSLKKTHDFIYLKSWTVFLC